ncbi:hypothetical protein [Cobetia sp. QF-1]|uniref:glycosyltransferase n=1 Tax=Cobetia sp. QF-1 TaxID=1969833 RepID=UPI000B545320
MGYGLPIVISNILENRHSVNYEENGLLFPTESSEHLADALVRLFAVDSLKCELGRAARSTIEAQYDLQQRVNNMAFLYRIILNYF